MAHVFRRKRIHSVPVIVSHVKDGTNECENERINVTFEAGKVEDFRGIDIGAVSPERMQEFSDALESHVRDWDMLDPDTGEKFECTPEHVAEVLTHPNYQIGFIRAWAALSNGQKRKNL